MKVVKKYIMMISMMDIMLSPAIIFFCYMKVVKKYIMMISMMDIMLSPAIKIQSISKFTTYLLDVKVL